MDMQRAREIKKLNNYDDDWNVDEMPQVIPRLFRPHITLRCLSDFFKAHNKYDEEILKRCGAGLVNDLMTSDYRIGWHDDCGFIEIEIPIEGCYRKDGQDHHFQCCLSRNEDLLFIA